MKINRARQQESVAVFGRETSLIRDVLDNLELEHALTWLLEAISQHQSGKMGGEPWHLYQFIVVLGRNFIPNKIKCRTC